MGLKIKHKILNQLRLISSQDRSEDVKRVHYDIMKMVDEECSKSYNSGALMGACATSLAAIIGHVISTLL